LRASVDDINDPIADGVEMIEYHSMLHHHVRFRCGVRLDAEVAIGGTGVHPTVDLQQRHADIARIAIRQSPEAAVRIPVFGADPRVQDVGAKPWQREDLFFQQRFASRNHQVRAALRDETCGRFRVWRRDDALWGERWWKTDAELIQRAPFPRSIAPGERQRVIGAEGEDVAESQRSDTGQLASDPLAFSGPRLADDENPDERRERRKPPREAFAIECGVFVADEDGTRHQQMPR
jgi:hypothetical protein